MKLSINKKRTCRNNSACWVYLFLLFVGLVFVLNFSYSTSPLTPYYWGGDTAQFLTIGKAWYLGKIPYKEMFNHKGPFIFFVDMIGFALTRGKSATGVFALQAVFMLFSLTAFYKLGRLFLDSASFGIMTCLVALICTKLNYVEGNTVEEYCIPFIAWSLYGVTKWFKGEDHALHDPMWAFVYGLTFGVCLLTRVTNAITIVPSIGIIFFLLLYRKKYKNILQNMGGFLVGFFVIVLPFSLYFAYKNCFYEYIDGMILYNVKYANARKSWIFNATSADVIGFIKNFFVAWSILLAALLCALRKNYLLSFYYALTGIAELWLFMGGDNFGQYAYVCLPQVCLLIGEIACSIRKNGCEEILSIVSVQILCWFMGICILDSMSVAPEIHRNFRNRYDRGWDSLIAEIPEEDKNSFVAYGDNRLKELYLLNDIMPCYKYFSIQEWHASMSTETQEKIHETFATCQAKWILVGGETTVINDILESAYKLVDSNGDYMLYRLNV